MGAGRFIAAFAKIFFGGKSVMGCFRWLVVGVAILLAGVGRLEADASAPWRIGRIDTSDVVQFDSATKPREGQPGKFLSICIAASPAAGEMKLHEFRIQNAKGETVAELYGFHKNRRLLVFEGDWSQLEGLFLDGGRHREPLVPEPPTVMARGTKPAAVKATIARSEASKPAMPEQARGPIVPTRQNHPPTTKAIPPREPNKFYQDVVVGQRSRYGVQGMEYNTDTQYRILSSLSIDKRADDGGLAITQKVEQTELLQSDPATQPTFKELLGQMKGATTAISVDPQGHVTAMKGTKQRMRAGTRNDLLGGKLPLLASVIDPDGWKEISEITFLRPPATVTRGTTWQRPMVHRWDPLGTWTGHATYALADREGTLDRILYKLNLGYEPAKASATGLPFKILRSDFHIEDASGAIEYDIAKARTLSADEQFSLKGALTVDLFGQETLVEVQETQNFHVRILDQKPEPTDE